MFTEVYVSAWDSLQKLQLAKYAKFWSQLHIGRQLYVNSTVTSYKLYSVAGFYFEMCYIT